MACRGGKDEIGPDRGSHKTEAVKCKLFLWDLEHPDGRGGTATGKGRQSARCICKPATPMGVWKLSPRGTMHRTIKLPLQGNPTEGRENLNFSASIPDSHWLKAVPRTGNIHPLALLALVSGRISKRKPSDKEMDEWHWEISRMRDQGEGSDNLCCIRKSVWV